MNKPHYIVLIFLFVANLFFGQIQFHRHDTVDVYHGATKLDVPWFGGINAGQFSRVDLDLDGIEDLVVFDRSGHKLMTFINKGTTNATDYRYAYEYERKFPEVRGWLLMRDFNGDGKKDVFASTSGGIQVYKNISTIGTGLKFDLYKPLVISYQGFTAVVDSTKFFNLYVSSVDIPAISDIDGDGDLDVLSFGVLGSFLEYHRNMSVEEYGHADSLNYVLKNACWGYFSETGSSTNKLKFNDTCYYNVTNPHASARHTGSTIMAFDNNEDSVADVLMGDVSFGNLVMAQNGGTSPNSNSAMNFQDTAFPSYDTSVDLELFPAPFYEDVDNDGIKDLIVSPNTDVLTENATSVYYYKNLGSDNLPNFSYRKKDFMQDQGIELGERSMTAIFDHNNDGLMDMVISSYGTFNAGSITYTSKLSLYENTGTASQPAFTLITDDYMGISTMGLGLWLYPTFGDIDGDLDMDLILGESEGKIHLLTNTPVGGVANFALTTQDVQDATSATIDVGQFSSPQLFDYDNDTDLDLIIGEKNGIISYYENTGTTTAFSFTYVTDSMGEVEVHEPWDIYGSSTGHTTPFFFKQSGTTYMITGSQGGEVYVYNNIDPTDATLPFTMMDTVIQKGEVGEYTTTTLVDIDGNTEMDMFMGNSRGGVACFYAGSTTVGIKPVVQSQAVFNLYPNPANEQLTIEKLSDYNNDQIEGQLYTSSGQLLTTFNLTNRLTLNVSNLSKGVYFIKLEGNRTHVVKRFIKQ